MVYVDTSMVTGVLLILLQIATKLIIKSESTIRKYPLCGYILDVLTHTTAKDRLWGGDETLNMYFGFASARVF